MEIIFFGIPSNPPPIAVQHSITNQFYQKKIICLYIFNNKKCKTEMLRRVLEKLVTLFFLYTKHQLYNSKINCSMNSERRWAGDCLGYQKKNYFYFKTWEKMVTKFGQFQKLECREVYHLCKLSQLCYHFLSSFGNKNNFFWYP